MFFLFRQKKFPRCLFSPRKCLKAHLVRCKGRKGKEKQRRQQSMRGGAGRTLLKSLNFNSKSFPSNKSVTPVNGRPLQRLRYLAAATQKPPPPVQDQENRSPESKTSRDSMILEMFRRRQLKGYGKDRKGESNAARDGAGPTKVVSCFEELGLSKEVIGAIGEVGVVIPSEVQCLGIPAVLEGKNLVLLGPPESGRTSAYLLPLIQLLRKDAASFGIKRESPRAIVLCPSEEECDQVSVFLMLGCEFQVVLEWQILNEHLQVFCAARLITSHAQFKSVAGVGLTGESRQKEDSSPAPIGMLVGTPEEIHQQIEDQDIILTNTRYFVLDEADTMLDSDIFTKIHKIFSLLKSHAAEDSSLQTILVASNNEKMLGNEPVESLERKESGKVTAIMLEMDEAEVPSIFESPSALRKRVVEAVRSLAMAPSSS